MPHQPSSLGFDCKDIQSDIECIFGSTGKTKKVQIKVNSNVTGPEQSMIWKKTIRDLKQRQLFFFTKYSLDDMVWLQKRSHKYGFHGKKKSVVYAKGNKM